jgi:hypothetical protein
MQRTQPPISVLPQLSTRACGPRKLDDRARRVKKNTWETLTGSWLPHDARDQVVDFVRRWWEKTEIGVGRFIHWLGVTASKFYDWRQRHGCLNEPDALENPRLEGAESTRAENAASPG